MAPPHRGQRSGCCLLCIIICADFVPWPWRRWGGIDAKRFCRQTVGTLWKFLAVLMHWHPPRSPSTNANWLVGTLPGAPDALAVTMGTAWPRKRPGQWRSTAVYPQCLASRSDLPNRPSERGLIPAGDSCSSSAGEQRQS